MAVHAQPESILGVMEGPEPELTAPAGDASPAGLYVQHPSEADAFAMVDDLQNVGYASAFTKSTKGETEFCTPPASVGKGFDEKASAHAGSASYSPNLAAPIGLLLGADHVSSLPQAFQFPPTCAYPPIPSTSPINGIDSGKLSHDQPSSPEFSLAMLEETIASAEFNAQLQAARAVGDIRARAGDACYDAAMRGPHPDELDSLIAAQIATAIRKDTRRRTAPPGMKSDAGSLSKKKGQVAKRPASGWLSHTVNLPEYQPPPTAAAGSHNIAATTGYPGGAGLVSSNFQGSRPGTTSAALPHKRQGRGGSKAQHGSKQGPTKSSGSKGQKGKGGLEGKVEKTFKCELCPKVFERRYNLKVHMSKLAVRFIFVLF